MKLIIFLPVLLNFVINLNSQVLDKQENKKYAINYQIGMHDLAKQFNQLSGDTNLLDSTYSYIWDYDLNDWTPKIYYSGWWYGNKFVSSDSSINTNNESIFDLLDYPKSTFVYYNNNSIKSVTNYNWNPDEQQYYSLNYIEYSEDGREVSYFDWNADKDDWEGSQKQEYSFDNNGNITIYIEYLWSNETNNWINNQQITYEYNSNNNQTAIVFWLWSCDLDCWVENYKSKSEYNENNNKILLLGYQWDPDYKKWNDTYKIEYDYDENGYQTLFAEYFWEEYNNRWYKNRKIETVNNEQGDYSRKIYYENHIHNNEWLPSAKYDCYYNENFNLITDQYSRWDLLNGEWSNHSKNEYSYDSLNNMIETVNYFWNFESLNWEIEQKDLYVYNDRNERIQHIQYIGSSSGDWIILLKTDYEYDEFNNLVRKTEFIWDVDIWDGTSIYEYKYSMQGYKTSDTHYYIIDDNLVGDYKHDWYFSGIDNETHIYKASDNFIVYPNPTAQTLNIQLTSLTSKILNLKIYNLAGQQILTRTIALSAQKAASINQTIDISHLEKGYYIISVSNKIDNTVVSQGVVVY